MLERTERVNGHARTPASWADDIIRSLPRDQTSGVWSRLPDDERPRGRIVAVVAAAAAVGKTLVALALARALVGETGKRVALVDLDLKLGTVGAALGIPTARNVLTAIAALDREDPGLLATHLAWAPAGFEFLAAPGAEPPVPVEAETFATLLRQLASQYDYVVVDTAPALDPATLGALRAAGTVLLVTTPSPRSLTATATYLAQLRERRQPAASVRVVLNRAQRGQSENSLGVAIAWRIGDDPNAERGLAGLDREGELSRTARAIAREIVAPPARPAPPVGPEPTPVIAPPAPSMPARARLSLSRRALGLGPGASMPARARLALSRRALALGLGGLVAAGLTLGAVAWPRTQNEPAWPAARVPTPIAALAPTALATRLPPMPTTIRAPILAVVAAEPTATVVTAARATTLGQPSPTVAVPTPRAPAPVAPAPSPTERLALGGAPRSVVDERFVDNGRRWPNDLGSTAWLAEGAYHLLARRPGRFVAVTPGDSPSVRDAVVSATFRKVDGPAGGGYGIVLRAGDPLDGVAQTGRYYVLEAGDRGEVGAWRREGDRWVDLLPWTRSTAVNVGQATNQLTAVALGSRLMLLVNDQVVASVEDSELTEGRVGVFVGGDANEVVLERFELQVGGR